jgi:hypothetical protein
MAQKQRLRAAAQALKRDTTDEAHKYVRGQVLPRAGGLLKDWGLLVSLLGALAMTRVIDQLPAANTPIDDVANALMDYSAIGLGACITALVLAIGLAPQARVEVWSTTYAEGREYSAYSELIFVVSWAASSQLLALVVAWTARLVGADTALMPADPKTSHVVLFCLATATVIYALWHLCTVIATLSMIGSVTIQEAQRSKGSPE